MHYQTNGLVRKEANSSVRRDPLYVMYYWILTYVIRLQKLTKEIPNNTCK